MLFITGCADIISIERLPTPTPSPTPVVPPTPTPKPVVSVASSGSPVRVVAETINLNVPVVEMDWQVEEYQGEVVSEWDFPETEAGWHRNSAGPGQGSNVVISGHNASLGGQVFASLDSLEAGDLVTLWTGSGEEFVYQIQEKTIVRTLLGSQEALDFVRQAMEPTPTERLTLITCWPNWTNTHRLVVIAEPHSG